MWSSEQVEGFIYALLDIINENKQLRRENLKLKEEKEIADKAFDEIATNNMNAIGDTLVALSKRGENI